MRSFVRFFATSLFAFSALAGMSAELWASVVDFEDLTLAENSYWNGADGSGGFTSGGAAFNNNFQDFGGGWYLWDGWAYSNVNDPVTTGYGNQYAAVTGTGLGGAGNYAVAYVSAYSADPAITFQSLVQLDSIHITNTTYAYYDMLAGSKKWDGSTLSKKFGGDSGDEPDWFRLTITGWNGGAPVGSVEFYLADYRFEDNDLDYIVHTWEEVDLSGLPAVTRLTFSLASTDNDVVFGMNTPAYFAADGLTYTPLETPEPSTLFLAALAAAMGLARRRLVARMVRRGQQARTTVVAGSSDE